MKIGYTMGPNRGDTDIVLFQLAQSLIGRGLRPVGTVQVNSERLDGAPCDMDIKVLPDGETLRISQFRGRAARGCRLDPCAIETAVGLVLSELTKGADVLIVNKFGKHEAEGRGFRPVIAEAQMLGIPVLVGTNKLNRDSFLEFAGDYAVELAPERSLMEDWLVGAMGLC